jgi:hypothetical protein
MLSDQEPPMAFPSRIQIWGWGVVLSAKQAIHMREKHCDNFKVFR